MQKQAPSLGRILTAVGFALSCFGLLLFLWVTFGGPTPLAARSYRITAYFPEATTLALEADVRIGGVSVGRVKSIELAPAEVRVNGRDTAETVLEIEPEFAPIAEDARAILRQKTLLGETYVELTAGTAPDADSAIPEGGSLGIGRVREAVQIDEIYNALDEETRESGQRALRGSALALEGRGLDLNDALGNLGPFLSDAAEITEAVRRQRPALRGLIRDTGLVFEAISADDRELAGAITGSRQAFAAIADSSDPLAESIRILPTFERELTATLERLDAFGARARPVVRELLPVAGDVSPTLRSVRRLAPHLRRLLVDLDPLLRAAERGFPALRGFVAELRPALAALDPLLAELNPVVQYLKAYRELVATFISNPPIGVSGTLPKAPGQPAPRHFLRTLPYLSQESLGIYPTRLAQNRGNGYLRPDGYDPKQLVPRRIFPNFDCRNTDYTPLSQPPDEDEVAPFRSPPPDVNDGQPPGLDFAPCFTAPDFPERFGGTHVPHLRAEP